MQLVLAGCDAVQALARVGLDSYKYRSSVHVFDCLGEEPLAKLVAASYATILPFRRRQPRYRGAERVEGRIAGDRDRQCI